MKHILVVSNDEHVKRTLKTFLTQSGHDVIETWAIQEFGGNAHALRFLESIEPDLLIFDHVTSSTDDLDALRSMREKQPELVVIVLTDPHRQQIRREMSKAGVTGFITKRISQRKSHTALDQYLSPHPDTE